MKNILRTGGFVLLASLVLSGCSLLEQDVAEEVVDDNRPVAERIEDFDAYERTRDVILASGNKLGLERCEKHAEFEEQVQKGRVDQLVLFAKDSHRLEVYKTENYASFTNPMLSDYNTKCVEGAGGKRILRAFPDVLIWGFPGCTAGAAPTADDPSYQAFIDCQTAAEELQEYIAS